MKRCWPVERGGCGRELELTEENFYKAHRVRVSGAVYEEWKLPCRECMKKRKRNRSPAVDYSEYECSPEAKLFLYGRVG